MQKHDSSFIGWAVAYDVSEVPTVQTLFSFLVKHTPLSPTTSIAMVPLCDVAVRLKRSTIVLFIICERNVPEAWLLFASLLPALVHECDNSINCLSVGGKLSL